VFENSVLRRIFGPKRDEVTGEWRKLHSEELHSLYSSPDIIRHQIKENEVGGACGSHGGGEESVQSFGGKTRRNETTWKTKEDGIKLDWIQSAQDMGWWQALVNMVMNLRVLAPRHRVGWFVKSGMLQVCHCDSLFEVFIPPFQAQHTKVARVYDHFEVKVYLLYIYLTACLVANFKQRLWSN
jgi:hypothetical protein